MFRKSFVATLFFLLVGCAAPLVQVNGYSLHAEWWERDQRAVLSRASFDMQCPPEQLELTVIAARYDIYASQVGVRGCGQQIVYVKPVGNDTWVANSSTTAP